MINGKSAGSKNNFTLFNYNQRVNPWSIIVLLDMIVCDALSDFTITKRGPELSRTTHVLTEEKL